MQARLPDIVEGSSARDGHEELFGLIDAPFTPRPIHPFVFESASHTAALERLASAVPRGDALMVVTGATGIGKTTLCQLVAERCGPRAFVAVVGCPSNNGDEWLRHVLHAFGMLPDTSATVRVSRRALLEILQRFLLSLAPLKGQAVVVVDDAQRLEPDTLKTLDQLMNFETPGRKLLQVVLVGQPQLNDLLARTDLRHVSKHVSWHHELTPLGSVEVPRYVEHRLRAARESRLADREVATLVLPGVRSGNRRIGPFTASAMRAIVELSGGVPSVVNLLCDRSLQDAQFDRPGRIDRRMVLKAARSINLTIPFGLQLPSAWRLVVAATAPALVVVVMALGWAVRSGTLSRRAPVLAAPASRQSNVDDMATNGTSRASTAAAFDTVTTEVVPPASARRGGLAPDSAAATTATADVEPLDVLLGRAKALSVQPDVKALVHLRDDVAGREARATDGAVRAEIESALEALDRYLTDARRQQLLIDGQRLAEQERGQPTPRVGR